MTSTRLKTITREINRNQSIPLPIKRTLKQSFGLQEDAISLSESFTKANLSGSQLISGSATWLTGLTFAVSDCVFVIDGVLYTSTAGEVTLSAADGSNPRIDVIAVNKNGTPEVVTGTAAATPAKPEVDADSQVEVTFVTIATGATTPSGVTNTVIYAEDAEWTAAAVDATIDDDDTSDPHAGTKAVKFLVATSGKYITFTASAAVQPAAIDRFVFYIKNTKDNTARSSRLRFAWYNQATRVSNWINLYHGDYGYDGGVQSGYQLIQIPFGNFIPNGTAIDRLRIQVGASSGAYWSGLIDDISYQVGAPTVDTTDFAVLSRSNVYTAAQGSAIVTLTDAATVAWDMSPGNVYYLTLGGNRIMGAPTNVKPGYTYILFMDQGAGSRTITSWNAAFLWAGGTAPTLATAAAAVDVISFVAGPDGSLYGSLGIADAS